MWCVAEGDSEGAQTMWNLSQNDGMAEVYVDCDSANVVVQAGQYGQPLFESAAGAASFFEDDAGNLETFKLVLNGQDRFKEQSGKYFNQVQPFQHHSGSPYAGVYSYSFALKPEEHQPTGTCNFSRIDNAQVAVKCRSGGAASKNLDMFAVNYNVLRVQSGMGGLAFSN